MSVSKKIDELNNATELSSSDYFAVSQSGQNEATKATVGDLAAAVAELNETGAISELALSVSTGKNALVSALKEKGVEAASADSLTTLASKVRLMNATAAQAMYTYGVPRTDGGYYGGWKASFVIPGKNAAIYMDTGILYYVQQFGNFDGFDALKASALFTASVTDFGLGTETAYSIAISPNGNYMAFTRSSSCTVIEIGDSAFTLVGTYALPVSMYSNQDSSSAISDDGRILTYTAEQYYARAVDMKVVDLQTLTYVAMGTESYKSHTQNIRHIRKIAEDTYEVIALGVNATSTTSYDNRTLQLSCTKGIYSTAGDSITRTSANTVSMDFSGNGRAGMTNYDFACGQLCTINEDFAFYLVQAYDVLYVFNLPDFSLNYTESVFNVTLTMSDVLPRLTSSARYRTGFACYTVKSFDLTKKTAVLFPLGYPNELEIDLINNKCLSEIDPCAVVFTGLYRVPNSYESNLASISASNDSHYYKAPRDIIMNAEHSWCLGNMYYSGGWTEGQNKRSISSSAYVMRYFPYKNKIIVGFGSELFGDSQWKYVSVFPDMSSWIVTSGVLDYPYSKAVSELPDADESDSDSES